MDWSAEDIKKSFYGVIRDSRELNSSQLELKYADFKEKVEPLYKMAIDSVATGKVQEASKKLDMMLTARTAMQTGKMSKLNTDMFVGNQLGREYIYPVTNSPSREDYTKAVQTIIQKANEPDESEVIMSPDNNIEDV
jgi:hypothetical protein